MSKSTCAVPDCSIPAKRAGYCYGHYMKNWRYSTPTPEHDPRWVDIQGQRFGSLVVRERHGSLWICDCDCGTETRARAGDLNRGTKVSCGNERLHRRLDIAGYSAVHGRLRRDRGSASKHDCVDCGQRAYHWSYDHSDPDELLAVIQGCEIAYSMDADRYAPRCVPCHKRFDLDRINSASRLTA